MAVDLLAIITESTCSDACWYAREDVCRCVCGGENHGIMLTEDGERPPRTRRVKQVWYELEAVIPGWRKANEYCRRSLDLENLPSQYTYSLGTETYGPPILYAAVAATNKQIEKWPELRPHRDWKDHPDDECMADRLERKPFLIWRRKEVV